MEPTLLALDTSTERMALALTWPGGRSTRTEPGGAAASARLIPALLRLLEDAGLSMRDLDGIAFAAGPGAFTGLRTACSVAQGLACVIDRPLWPLDSLMLVAEDAASQREIAGVLWVAMDARMDEVYAAAYERNGEGWKVVDAPALYTVQALATRWHEHRPDWLAGSAAAAFGIRLPAARLGCLAEERDRGVALATLARRAWAVEAPIDAALAAPLYLRDKVALTSEERLRRASAAD